MQTSAEQRQSTPIKLIPPQLKLAEFNRNLYSISVAPDVGMDDLLRPEFWANVGMMLHSRDRIEVVTEDLTLYAELMVLSTADNTVRIKCLRAVDLAVDAAVTDNMPASIADFVVKWSGQAEKHRIIRTSDNYVLKSGFLTKAEANEWLAEHLRTG